MASWKISRPGLDWSAIFWVIWFCSLVPVRGMSRGHIAHLRQETVDMFYHGYRNYMKLAFPEDELRPVSCGPLIRDPLHPDNIGLNDVLGNYSLTLIDSLSTLAILASSKADERLAVKALQDFRHGVILMVENYGDGTEGENAEGQRARGFDLDSKVQVFETVIRGVGGLLSAHLFAAGELPLGKRRERPSALWDNGFVYDGQLLRLAHDLARRLLPAFYSPTGIPYPRVNLRHGIPFYVNSPYNQDAADGQCETMDPPPLEITETCSAGAGSLVLEFTTLSRLTGDGRFEKLAKRAFWEVWYRRSNIGLIGAGIDAESGLWTGPVTGIGAGIDSFFEYALKTHILLSGSSPSTSGDAPCLNVSEGSTRDPNDLLRPVTEEEDGLESFLITWHEAHAAIKRHLYRDIHHPHYINAHISTGSPQALWIDSLGAYYPGLLTLGGKLDEAIETHLLYTALWTRYSALPERWSLRDGDVEGGLGWWPGRPEFVESNYHLYRATRDPWYLYVGEMALRDIKRRCWTRCGWAGLQDVRTGELTDRMESFFLGETAKYLFLLFDDAHPLNTLDAPFVFTTEGHPLMLPRKDRGPDSRMKASDLALDDVCQVPPKIVPFSVSATAARDDLFHAARLTKLHLLARPTHVESPVFEYSDGHPSIGLGDLQSPTNYTFYPWTLPQWLIPVNGTSSKLRAKHTFDIQFPSASANILLGQQSLTRVTEGLVIQSLEGVRMGFILDEAEDSDGGIADTFRIHTIGNFALGRDEKVFIHRNVLGNIVDPNFSRIRDSSVVDLLVDLSDQGVSVNQTQEATEDRNPPASSVEITPENGKVPREPVVQAETKLKEMHNVLSQLIQQLSFAGPSDHSESTIADTLARGQYQRLAATIPTGVGAAPLPDIEDVPDPDASGQETGHLPFRSIYVSDESCTAKLPRRAASDHHVIVMKRGGCSFSEKLSNIPSFAPTRTSLQLVIVVSTSADGADDEDEDEAAAAAWEQEMVEAMGGRGTGHASEPPLVRPLLDKAQRTPTGLLRHRPIPMVMVSGSPRLYEQLATARGVGLRRRYHVSSRGVVVGNLVVL